MSNLLEKWNNNPEPSLPSMHPQVILDANVSGSVWLYNYRNECDEYLVYDGELMDRVE